MKRYQVFLSSTYEDLKEERTEVLNALLELDCIPCGMEYFPASDDSQWEYIKSLIELCDYYLLIVGGRYGSTDESGISYTEKEYRYAVSKNIPVIAFYHSSPKTLPVYKTDNDKTKEKKLEAFRSLVQKKLCKPWDSKEQLGAFASRSMSQLIKRHPRIGWIRANQATSEQNLQDLLNAKKEIELLKEKVSESQFPTFGIEELAKGSDKVKLEYFLYRSSGYSEGWNLVKDDNIFSWDELFDAISPKLSLPLTQTTFNNYLQKFLNETKGVKHKRDFKSLEEVIENDWHKIKLRFTSDALSTIKIQFIALGYITESIEKKEKKNRRIIELTDLGKKQLIIRKAVRKDVV